MTIEQRLEALAKHLLIARRDNLRTLARLKALESLVQHAIPESEQAAWKALLDKQTKIILQRLLESFEKQSPEFSALMDDRGSFELDDLE